ncbi:hypothetical protein HKX48_005795 [Thoreauomyces humboldtii]|nr:hypothetical protein HKX48_005795 [Thoreauomyces humboldtii]
MAVATLNNVFGLYLTVAYVLLNVLVVRSQSATLEEMALVARITAPLEIAFRDKLYLITTYILLFRVGIRWGGAYELVPMGEVSITLQVVLASTALMSVYSREKRQKNTFLASHLNTHSTNSLNTQRRSHRWHLSVRNYVRFVHDQGFSDPEDETTFRHYFSGKLQNETRIQYLIAFASAFISIVSLLWMYRVELTPAIMVNIGVLIPVGCLIGVACTTVRALGPSYPARQQMATTGIYLLLSGLSLYSTMQNVVVLGTTLVDLVPGPALDMYLASVFFHLNMMMSRAASGILRGRYALVCATADQIVGLILYIVSDQLVVGYQVLCAFSLVALFSGLIVQPWGEKNHRRYWRTVVKKRRIERDAGVGVKETQPSEDMESRKSIGTAAFCESIKRMVMLGILTQ